MSVEAQTGRKLDEMRESLRLSALASMSNRDVLLMASRLERIETAFRDTFASEFTPLNVTVVTSLSAQHFCSVLKLYLYAEGFSPTIVVSEYDGLATDGLDPNALIWATPADATIILPAIGDIKSWPRMFATEGEIQSWVDQHTARLQTIWTNARPVGSRTQIYHALLEQPTERLLGNLEVSYPFSRTRCLQRLNLSVVEAAERTSATVVDLDYLSSCVGRNNWFDDTAYFASKQRFALRELPTVAAYFGRQIAARAGRIRKCLVLDLDNTLWGGTVGDAGAYGIRISPSDPVGEAFLAFQRYAKSLKERGVLLAVCSKNERSIAIEAFESNRDMILRMNDFASFIANWDDKASNLSQIARELNISVDSLVFFDDNPAERERIKSALPQVFVVDVPADPAQFVRALQASFAFEWPQLTPEDGARADTFARERQREQLAVQFANYDEYLQSLDMRAEIVPATAEGLARLVQLFGKTNQFNLRNIRYSEADLLQLIALDNSLVLEVRFADRFSDYGVMAGVVLLKDQDCAWIDNWVMSCRVFKRSLEHATFNAILDIAGRWQSSKITGEYLQTPKNAYVKTFFSSLGFTEIASGTSGKLYSMDAGRTSKLKHFISVGDNEMNASASVTATGTR